MPPEPLRSPLTSEEEAYLLALARDSLERAFRQPDIDDFLSARDGAALTAAMKAPAPCFVTLEKRDRLRGCLGCTESSTPLYENVARYARHAAFDDPRFRPVELHEMAQLSIHVTVLGEPRLLGDLSEVEIGRHGLWVKAGDRRGLLLASVAPRFNWTREEFLRQTFLKAGLIPEKTVSCEIRYFEEWGFGDKD